MSDRNALLLILPRIVDLEDHLDPRQGFGASPGQTLRKYDFIEAQFRSTRNAKCNNPISHMLWGGMQWQLEHHIFPTMPRYKYPAVSKVLQKFAKENDIDYRISGEFAIIAENVALLKKIGEAEAVKGNPTSEPIFKQV